ncbi:hypothetical protein Klosneuvirus_2_43 [Klosneuvirus KNV1]|uniref:Uncharacterized protein n=1 Tax=Klosneuvirus KNV1 TaxID=1977640 RepID=A0A1V0SIQ6_9VIRU|nr:hypothetical protein Klosneuvirus_2_43 [Klosneuvirus KNV1]
MSVVYKYRLWCLEENTFVYTYNDTVPTICPNNHTDRSLDDSKTTIVDKITPETSTIVQNVPGYYQMATTIITVPSGATGSIYEQTFSFPMDLQLWLMEFTSIADMVGDNFHIVAAPETIIGAVIAPVSTSDTVLTVTNTVFTSGVIAKGLEILLDDGANKQSLGLVTAVDETNSQLTIQNPPSVAYSPGSYVKMNIYVVKNQVIDVAGKTFVYGRKGITTKTIAANTPLKFVYTNNNGLAKNLYFNLEFNYY